MTTFHKYVVHLYRRLQSGELRCICAQHFDEPPTLAEIQAARPIVAEIAVYQLADSAAPAAPRLLELCERSLAALKGEYALDDDLEEIKFATDLENAIRAAKGGAATTSGDKKTITVYVEGGVCTDVCGLPAGWDYEIVDYDDEDANESERRAYEQALAAQDQLIKSRSMKGGA